MNLPDLTFENAKVLGPDGLHEQPVGISDGLIGAPSGRRIDLSGYMVLPGIIDLHGDGFERHLAPRRGVVKDMRAGLASVDAELAASGITTAVLAQFFSWEGGMRGPDFAEEMMRSVRAFSSMTDMQLQLRLETHLIDSYDRALALIEAHEVGYVVLNDHVPHAALAAGKRPPRLTGQALKSGRSPEAHLDLLKSLHACKADVPAAMAKLATKLTKLGVQIGSHDDPDTGTRSGFRALGARIAEFPETLDVAMAAKAAGDAVIMGAPNVVRGGSHDKKVSAEAVIRSGACDALVSDYHYPALAQAAFALADRGVVPFEAAWRLISSGPARVMGWTDRGDILPGLRADMVAIDIETRKVAACLTGGQISYLAGPLAGRFMNGTM